MNAEKQVELSLVIPIYNSAAIIATTIDRTVGYCETSGLSYELVLVNDASRDASWNIVREKALANPCIIAVDLLKNYGQHTAIFCGLQISSGRYIVTLDDDLQNPPEEIAHLLAKASEGHDLVFGRFRQKRHPFFRRLGSWAVLQLNRRLFNCPDDLVVSNFRLMTADVARRICAYKTSFPYITGLSLMFARSPANVLVEHHERPVGKSTYTLPKLMRFVIRILLSYSPYPIWITAWAGLAGIALSLLGFFVLSAAVDFSDLSTMELFSIFGVIAILIGLLTVIALLVLTGEYIARLIRAIANSEIYIIRERIH